MPLKKYQAIIFDLGNTLILEDYSGRPVEARNVVLMDGVAELIEKLTGRIRLAIVSNTTDVTAEQIQIGRAHV